MAGPRLYRISMTHIPSIKEILKKYPYDRSEDVAKYQSDDCGHEIEIARQFLDGRYGYSPVELWDYIKTQKCHICGRPFKNMTVVKQNYEKRIEAAEERDQLLRETWQSLMPRDEQGHEISNSEAAT